MRTKGTGWIAASAKLAVLFILAANITGCSLLRSSISTLKSTDHFVPMTTDRRVLSEPGADDVAVVVAADLADAIATVEKEQYRAFAKPVQVYVTRDEESFAAFTGVSKQALGTVIIKVFLSGKLRKEPDRIRRILVHELSHLHLGQQLGIYGYNANLPSWFQEGLAVTVSGGGGAEKMSEAGAARAILAGTGLKPEASGSFFFKKFANSYGVEPPLFYRQSGMFVAWLRNYDLERFRLFLLAIEDGKEFEGSFNQAYGMNLDEAWQRFTDQLKMATKS
ncbi:MAG TPA: hypothetical protein VGJ93_12265 [Desulfuromonadaceae bacterium]|jgi:hypothetical protein